MRKNPYLKQEQEFRPLLMRGSFGNKFLITSEQTRQELSLASEISKKTYDLNGVTFDMVQPPSLNTNGAMLPTMNVEMCTTECTQELFEWVMGFNYSRRKLKPDKAKRPVEMVTWFDCIIFCNKLSEILGYLPYYDVSIMGYGKDWDGAILDNVINAEVLIVGGNGFRLPTISEWETFAKAGTDNKYIGTNNKEEINDYAWSWNNAGDQTHVVADLKPNAWGMYDMTGNVWEWVWDKKDITNTKTSAVRILRGGGYYDIDLSLELSYHREYPPNGQSGDLGFRFARTIEQK